MYRKGIGKKKESGEVNIKVSGQNMEIIQRDGVFSEEYCHTGWCDNVFH